MKKQLTLILGILFLAISMDAQNSLKILNPNWFDFEGENGTIDEAVFTIEPQGLYMEVGMYLTLSAEGLGYPITDTLEIVLDFNLPSGSIVHDSWLWMDEDLIVKADMYDIWSATTIYEDIVDRRRDPSILYKKKDGGYQIRVFPLAGTESRKIKITYLSPAIWLSSSVETWIPLDILQTSAYPLEHLSLITKPDVNWTQPVLPEIPGLSFDVITDPFYGEILLTNIPNSNFDKPLHFSVEAPFDDNGVFINQIQEGNDAFYQMAYMPPEVPLSSAPRKIALLFDHEQDNAPIDKLYLYEYTQKMLSEYLQPEDRFNMFFARQNGSVKLSDDWVEGDQISMQQAFDQFDNDPISDESNLLELLEDGIAFINNNGGEGDLVLVASSDNLPYWETDQNLDHTFQLIGQNDIKIHIINYQSRNFYFNWIWNGPDEWFYYNEDFYNGLNLGTSGNFYDVFGGDLNVWESINSAISSLKSVSYNYDLYTTLSDGFTFQRFHQTYLGQSLNTNRPILQIGKFIGDFPLELSFTAQTDSGFVYDNQIIEEAAIIQADTLSREIWMGHHLRQMEGNASGNSEIQEIIDLSIEERVLTGYTAFLALEVAQGGEPCVGCWDYDNEWIVPAINVEPEKVEIRVTASPNPFSDYIKLDFEVQGESSVQQLDIRIFDVYGKLVEVVDPTALLNLGTMLWTWDGKDENGNLLSSGIYFLVVKTDKGIQNLKLSLIR